MALGPYRDRLLLELAQNAADAALRAGTPGRLRLTLVDGTLVAANTGTPLDPAGVESLSTLRASAKRADADATGRFGVGFAAVRTASDAPAVRSTTGGVRWSLAQAREVLHAIPTLVAELADRGDALPVLRLPFPDDTSPPAGFDTAVVVPLRDDGATAAVRRELAELDPGLLLSLPSLVEVEVESRRLTARRAGPDVLLDDDGELTRWRLVRRSGRLAAGLLADRPTEERARTGYEVCCAVPLGGAADGPVPVPLPSSLPAVLRGPTLTDEPLSLPVVMIGSWPLDSGRRRVAAGPLADALVQASAAAYAELVREVATGPGVLDLVPAGLAAGALDAALRRAICEELAETPFLPLAEGTGTVRPRDAVALDLGARANEVLAEVLPDVLPAEWAARLGPLAVLGVRRLTLPEVVDALAGLDRPPTWWRRLYEALAESHLGGPERDALGALPVPLADGRLIHGPRGLLLPGVDLNPAGIAALDLRVVSPDAVAPLLTVLGAVPATARSLLVEPRLQAAVAASFDAEDPEPIADAVLGLVAAAGVAPGEMPALADLALPAADGELYPAGELLLPGSPFAEVIADDAPFGIADPELVARWGAPVLTGVGVLDGFAVLREADVLLHPDAAQHDLDGESDWLAEVLAGLPRPAGVEAREEAAAPPMLTELVAVRDLELVRDDAWERALALLPRQLLTEPALVLLPDGRRAAVSSYTRWWLARAAILGGRRPADLTLAGSDLVGLYDEAPPLADPELLLALGVRSGVESVLDEPGGAAELLARLGSDRPVDRDLVRKLHGRLAVFPADVAPPAKVRAVRGNLAVAVPPAEAVVVDVPDLLPLVAPLAVVPAPLGLVADVADLLDLPLAGELARFDVVSPGVPRHCRYGDYLEHSRLLVGNADGVPTAVPWRVLDGVVHVDAAAGPDALGRAVAWRDNCWTQRWLRATLLRSPEAAVALAAERDLD